MVGEGQFMQAAELMVLNFILKVYGGLVAVEARCRLSGGSGDGELGMGLRSNEVAYW